MSNVITLFPKAGSPDSSDDRVLLKATAVALALSMAGNEPSQEAVLRVASRFLSQSEMGVDLASRLPALQADFEAVLAFASRLAAAVGSRSY